MFSTKDGMESLWTSENPLETVRRIDINFATDGDVIASQYEACNLIILPLNESNI
jgi:hypothetical protein